MDLHRNYVKTFTEHTVERRRSLYAWSPTEESKIDKDLNDWVFEKCVCITDIRTTDEVTDNKLVKVGGEEVWERQRLTKYVVLYQPIGEFDYEGAHPKVVSETPLQEGAKSPAFEVIIEDTGGIRKAFVMAGVFGVPEGQKYSMEDTEIALTPLFSPDLQLSKYKGLFENIGESK